MKIKNALILCLPLLITSCSNDDIPSKIDFNRASKILEKINTKNIKSFDFIDRSYNFDSYNNSKYIVTGSASKALINYEARHKYNLYNNNFIADEIEIDALIGVESVEVINTTNAKGQIYQEGNYLYDYFIGPNKDDNFVNCYTTSKYRTLDIYFNYLSLIKDTINFYQNVNALYPAESGFSTPLTNISNEDNKETYLMSVSYPGDSTYMAFTYEYEVIIDSKTKSLDTLKVKLIQYKDTISGDYENEARTYIEYTLSNFKYGKKSNYEGEYNNFSMINERSIHNKPAQIVDTSNIKDGNLTSDDSLKIARNIFAYGENIKQCNYEFIYHDAFDIVNVNNGIGNMKFKGIITSYSNDIQLNNGFMQKINNDDIPTGDKSNYQIFTIADDDGVKKGGKFDKYMTNCFAYLSKDNVVNTDNVTGDLRSYTGANPLLFPEFRNTIKTYQQYNLGKTIDSNVTVEISASGYKNGDNLSITTSIRKYGSLVDNTYTFTYEINKDDIKSCKFVVSGQLNSGTKYIDTYQATFLSGNKDTYKGEYMDFSDIYTQVGMEAFYAF